MVEEGLVGGVRLIYFLFWMSAPPGMTAPQFPGGHAIEPEAWISPVTKSPRKLPCPLGTDSALARKRVIADVARPSPQSTARGNCADGRSPISSWRARTWSCRRPRDENCRSRRGMRPALCKVATTSSSA